jgi:hypothetical protein
MPTSFLPDTLREMMPEVTRMLPWSLCEFFCSAEGEFCEGFRRSGGMDGALTKGTVSGVDHGVVRLGY